MSALLARQIEAVVAKDNDYERAKRHALAVGFHLGGGVRVSRDEVHDRSTKN